MAKLSECKKCGLHKKRTRVVIGRGAKNANILFVGEAPGKEEDKKGEPFIGRAGEWFEKIIKTLELKKHQFYITNINKCRPCDSPTAKNRNPTPIEIEACMPWLNAQIRFIKPKIIVLMGGTALRAVLGLEGMELHRGRIFYEGDTLFFAMLHPATLVYDKKKNMPKFKDDLAVLKRLLREAKIR